MQRHRSLSGLPSHTTSHSRKYPDSQKRGQMLHSTNDVSIFGIPLTSHKRALLQFAQQKPQIRFHALKRPSDARVSRHVKPISPETTAPQNSHSFWRFGQSTRQDESVVLNVSRSGHERRQFVGQRGFGRERSRHEVEQGALVPPCVGSIRCQDSHDLITDRV